MLQADIYTYNNIEYIVLDTAQVAMDKKALTSLASYRHGVGADRILLVDKTLSQLIAVADSQGSYQLLSPEDCQVANAALGKTQASAAMHYTELHVTEYFLQKILPVQHLASIAG